MPNDEGQNDGVSAQSMAGEASITNRGTTVVELKRVRRIEGDDESPLTIRRLLQFVVPRLHSGGRL